MIPPSAFVFGGTMALALGVLSFGVWRAWRLVRYWRGQSVTGRIGRALLVLALGAAVALFVQMLYTMRSVEVTVTADALRITGTEFERTLPLEALRARDAGVLDLDRQGAFWPEERLRGVDVPGYQVGEFQLRNRQDVLVFVTDPSRVAYVPTRGGYALLLSVRDPQALVDLIRRRAPAPPPDPLGLPGS
jgi:hypothetical protein